MINAWKFCLSWNVQWSEFHALDGDEEAALFIAAERLNHEREK